MSRLIVQPHVNKSQELNDHLLLRPKPRQQTAEEQAAIFRQVAAASR